MSAAPPMLSREWERRQTPLEPHGATYSGSQDNGPGGRKRGICYPTS